MNVTEREERIHRLLGVRSHADGCPGEDDPAAARVEAFELERRIIEQVFDDELGELVERVARREPVTVVRCQECAGQREFEGPLADVLGEPAR